MRGVSCVGVSRAKCIQEIGLAWKQVEKADTGVGTSRRAFLAVERKVPLDIQYSVNCVTFCSDLKRQRLR